VNRSAGARNELYAMPPFKAAYDTDMPAGFRELCDTLAGPDGMNLIASPRLDALRATLAGAVVNAASTAAPVYAALVAAVTPVATRLDARERQELSRMHSWRLAVDNKVSGPTPAVSLELRDDLWSVVTTSRAAGPAAPGPAGPAEAPPPAPVPNAAQTAFLSAITLTAPASPSNATLAEHPLKFEEGDNRRKVRGLCPGRRSRDHQQPKLARPG
jgi:hypothetical protein